MCISIFVVVVSLIEKNIHKELENKRSLVVVEEAAVTDGNQRMDFLS